MNVSHQTIFPKIKKAKRIVGRSLVFRDACLTDAAFILALRTDVSKSKFLSTTSPEMTKQIAWLENYATLSDQAYFIIEDRMGGLLGCVRLYDPQGDSFCWGSWILKDSAPQNAAIESALMVYSYALDFLGFKQAHFEVRKGNDSVWRFHERFGAVRVYETNQDYFYQIDQNQITASRQRYHKYLPQTVMVEL